MWIWAVGHCRQYAWIRRSHAFRGLVPHFGYAEQGGWRYLKVVEYVPPKRKLWTKDNLLIGFRGTYRVWHFRLVAVERYATKTAAMGGI